MSFFISRQRISFEEELEQFQNDCFSAFQIKANQFGIKIKHTMVEPELESTGKDIISHFFNDSYTHLIFGDDANKYYHFIMCQTLKSGIECEKRWCEDRATFPGLVNSLKLSGPSDRSQEFLDNITKESQKGRKSSDLCYSLFAEFVRLMDRYWSHGESQDYVERAMLAVFCFGICMAAREFE